MRSTAAPNPQAPVDLIALADNATIRVEVKAADRRVRIVQRKRHLNDAVANVLPEGIEYYPPVNEWP
jgi:hypothetical protein